MLFVSSCEIGPGVGGEVQHHREPSEKRWVELDTGGELASRSSQGCLV